MSFAHPGLDLDQNYTIAQLKHVDKKNAVRVYIMSIDCTIIIIPNVGSVRNFGYIYDLKSILKLLF